MVGVVGDAEPAVEAGLHALGDVGGEMKPGMDDNPLGTEQNRGVDVGVEIGIDGVGNQRGVFGDLDGREGVQAEANLVVVEGAADRVGSGGRRSW